MFGTWRIGVFGAVALSLSGCVYIGSGVYTNKTECLDEDGDGVPAQPQDDPEGTYVCPSTAEGATPGAPDCDDHDAERYPGKTEIPYDAIDQDCDPNQFDAVDLDGDTYPGVDHDTWAAITRASGDLANWPAGVLDGSGAKGPYVDCDDAVAEVHPDAKEAFYDGVDSDCKGDDDYDADGDGYVRDEDAGSSKLPANDCDDTNAKVNPGVKNDAWYDGVDSNCDHVNDFDQDGDGYMSPPRGTATLASWKENFYQFCRQYEYVPSTTGSDCADYQPCYDALYDNQVDLDCGTSSDPDRAWRDCADSEDDMPTDAPIGAADVYPDAQDDLYDGVDADCHADNDFDADGDLYIDSKYDQQYRTYMAFWGVQEYNCHDASFDRTDADPNNDGVGVCAGSDCNDDSPTVHPNDPDDQRPGVMEKLNDKVDTDCDGSNDLTPWQYGGYGWNAPRNVVVGKNGLHWLLATAATDTDAAPYKNVGLAFYFDPTAAIDDGPLDSTTWFLPQVSGVTQVIGSRIDMIPHTTTSADQFDGFYGAVSYTTHPTGAGQDATVIVVRQVYWEPTASGYRNHLVYRQVNNVLDTFADVDVRVDGNGNVWGLGCGPSVFSYVAGYDGLDAQAHLAFPYKTKGCFGFSGCDTPAGPVVPAAPTQCFMDPPAAGNNVAKGTVCNGTTCTTYDLDGTTSAGTFTTAATQPYSSLHYAQTGVDWQNGFRTIIPDTGTGFQLIKDGSAGQTVLSGFTFKAAAASEKSGKLYIVGVVADQSGDGKDDVLIAYGPSSAASFTTLIDPLIIDGVTLDPDEVSIYADTDRVMIGVSGKKTGSACLSADPGLCDVVAWAFVGPS